MIFHWFWGCSVYIWTRYRINYIFLFDFNPRIVETPLMIFNQTTDESLVFFILMLLYYKVRSVWCNDVYASPSKRKQKISKKPLNFSLYSKLFIM